MVKDFEERVKELTAEFLPKYGGDVEEYEGWGYSEEVAEAMVEEDIGKAKYRAVWQAIKEFADPGVKRSKKIWLALITDTRLTVAAAEKKVAKVERLKLELERDERSERPGQMDRIKDNLVKLHRIVASPAGRGTPEGQVQWRFMFHC